MIAGDGTGGNDMIEVRRCGRVQTALLGALALGVVGCSSGGSSTSAGSRTQSHLGDDAIASVRVVADAGPDRGPLDAAPSPDGSVVYFTADGTAGPIVLGAPGTGGATFTLVAGAPLVKPVGVAVATDGSRVFVADPGAGRIFSVPSGGGAPTVVAGSEGRSPRGLDVAVAGGSDVVYFTGTDPADGAPAVFTLPAAGGTATVVAKGAPLVSPDAVVTAGAGVLYVTDRGKGADQGAVLKVSGSTVTKIADSQLGDPGGVSLTSDLTTLLVSSQMPGTGADQLLLTDLASGRSGTATKVIGANHNSSGGLHRAYRTKTFGWCDVSRSGKVYRVEPAA